MALMLSKLWWPAIELPNIAPKWSSDSVLLKFEL